MTITPADLAAAIKRYAKKHPDIEWGFAVRPDGRRGKHIAKLKCSDQEIAVSGPPDQTFRPGTVVGLASHQRGQDKVMLAYPPPAGRGSGRFGVDQGGNAGASCPTTTVSGVTHWLASTSGNTAGYWYAWSYAGGVLTQIEETVATFLGFPEWTRRDGDVVMAVVGAADGPGSGVAIRWDTSTNTLEGIEPLAGVIAGQVIYSGAYYYTKTAAGAVQLYSLPTNFVAATPESTHGATFAAGSGYTMAGLGSYGNGDLLAVLTNGSNIKMARWSAVATAWSAVTAAAALPDGVTYGAAPYLLHLVGGETFIAAATASGGVRQIVAFNFESPPRLWWPPHWAAWLATNDYRIHSIGTSATHVDVMFGESWSASSQLPAFLATFTASVTGFADVAEACGLSGAQLPDVPNAPDGLNYRANYVEPL